ncbi:MAG: LPS export ABC transporter periplasmic protein LptC [Mariprofundus sp.]
MLHGSLRWLKWASLLLAAGSVMVAVFLLWSTGPNQLLPGQNNADKPKTQVEAPVIVERKDGQILWQLRASEASQQLDGKMQLTAPQLRLYTESGQEILIKGKQAWFNPLKRDVQFQDQVRVRYEAWTLTSHTLVYDSGSDQIRIPGSFKLHGKSMNAHGKNLTILRESEQVIVTRGIWIKDTKPKWQGVAP